MSSTDDTTASEPAPRRRRAASRPAGPPVEGPAAQAAEAGGTSAGRSAPAVASGPEPAADRPTRRRSTKKAAPAVPAAPEAGTADPDQPSAADSAPKPKRTRKSTKAAADPAGADPEAESDQALAPKRRKKAAAKAPAFSAPESSDPVAGAAEVAGASTDGAAASLLMFQAPEPTRAPAPRRAARAQAAPDAGEPASPVSADEHPADDHPHVEAQADEDEAAGEEGPRRRRRRGGRGRRRRAGDETETEAGTPEAGQTGQEPGEAGDGPDVETAQAAETPSGSRRRRRRRGGSADGADDPPNTVTRAREPRSRRGGDEITAIKGSTRLEAKKQRRREGREAGRRRPSILSEAEFLARREAVERVMVVRELHDRTQIAVLEDGVLVEHYVDRDTRASLIGNVYLGKVQNVLPSMEAAFVDIGRSRNAVLYAGEVNWDAAGMDGQPRRIETALKSGDSVLVQVSKDPIGHKGARLTSQISLPGRFLVYVPEAQMTGISRKLPDTERNRLKSILRNLVPENAGVIVRTASEGASEDDLTRDVQRLTEQWEQISKRAKTVSAPALLQGEQDLAIKVVRDIFNEDFTKLVVDGPQAWATIESYVTAVAPDLVDRLEKWVGTDEVFHAYRVDEQLAKALDRKVWLPSGGSLVIDRTEAMTVVDVNTGKFTGSGGNLEETVTRNNLEAAEEIVRQLRLRDIGGIIVVDFIDMVLESNRDLVLRRLLECLGRDRTKHQVAEVTSLGLVQMTRKRIGQGLLEVFSEPCEQCHGRGVIVHTDPVESSAARGENGSAARPAIRAGAASAGAAKVHAAARKAAAEAAEAAEAGEVGEAAEGSTGTTGLGGDELAESAESSQTRSPGATVEDAHRDGEHPDGEHPDGEHPDGEHPDGEHPDGEHPDGEHPDGEHPEAVPEPEVSEPAASGPAEPDQAGDATPRRGRGGRRRVTRSAGPASADLPRSAV
jgi:ribonuclease E